MFNVIFDSLLAVAYPQVCQICENSVENLADGIVCDPCWLKTNVFSGSETLCFKCGAFLQSKSSTKSLNPQTFCHRCDRHFYDSAAAVGIYEHALAASVIRLKREPFITKRLRKLFVERFQNSEFRAATLIVPVPLSKKRFLERGFNQAVILSMILSKQFDIRFDRQSLARKIHTPMHRAGMDGKARALSVENAFEVMRPSFIKDEKILLVDDIYTSGATVSNCAKVLKESGADKVYVFTLARTL
jgi:ComF family protein